MRRGLACKVDVDLKTHKKQKHSDILHMLLLLTKSMSCMLPCYVAKQRKCKAD